MGKRAIPSRSFNRSVDINERVALQSGRLERMSVKKEIIQRPANGWNVHRITTHPGEMLREEFLKPMNISVNKLALKTRMPASRINEIVHERRSVTADTALRLARFFGTSPDFWLGLQSSHDLSKARMGNGTQIERDVEPLSLQTSTAA